MVIIKREDICMDTKLLCIYFPQFHRIPENDEWWREGFTEWDNVRRGRKFYPWQYQPREPLNNNYYDLSDVRVLEKHTRLAKKAGISGFCFYHYYMCGRKLLEKPIEMYRDESQETFPYCLIWANHSWTRTWYRGKLGEEVLLRQVYGGPDEWKAHFEYLLSFFKDDRYIKIDNKPVYIIYYPQYIQKRKEMFELWNSLAKQNGYDGIYLIAMNTGSGVDYNHGLYEGVMNFEPLRMIREDTSFRTKLMGWRRDQLKGKELKTNSVLNYFKLNTVYTYNYVCSQIENSTRSKKHQTFLGVFPGWDNTARKDEDGMIIPGSSPRRFEKHVEKVMTMAKEWGSPFVFLNAWNEWSEGPYVEPDKKYGYAYLRAIKRAIRRVRGK